MLIDGGGDFIPEAQVAAFVDTLGLSAKLEPRAKVSEEDRGLMLLQMQILGQNIWRELEPLVRHCVPLLPHGSKMHDDHLNECLDTAFDEKIMRGVQLTARFAQVSLNDLAREIYNPASGEYGPYRTRLRDNALFSLRDIGIWNVIEDHGISKNGTKFHRGFKISAGPVLRLFLVYIFTPWSERHARFTFELLSKKDL